MLGGDDPIASGTAGGEVATAAAQAIPIVRVEAACEQQSSEVSRGVWLSVPGSPPDAIASGGNKATNGTPRDAAMPTGKIRGGNAALRRKLKPLSLNQPLSNNDMSSNGDAQSIDNKTEKSELLSSAASSPVRTPPRHGSNESTSSRWTKLRTTVKMAGAVTQNKRKRKQSSLVRQDSFMKRFSTRHGGTSNHFETDSDDDHKEKAITEKVWRPRCSRFVIHPDENFMFYWMGLVTLTLLYNLWTCIAREGFPDIVEGYEIIWFTTDAICDTIYLCDIAVQLRTGYLEKGLIVYDAKKLAQNYTRSRSFIIDLLCLSPLDLLQLFIGIHPLIRFSAVPQILQGLSFHLHGGDQDWVPKHVACGQPVTPALPGISLVCRFLLHDLQSRELQGKLGVP